jgi:SAM-dependent methyltransferase
MLKDKSPFYYGGIYNKLFDPMVKQVRSAIIEMIPEGASVLDIGCGTGELCFALRLQKQCQITGIDLSLRMLEFAKAKNHFDDIRFLHQDATDLVDLQNEHFDYVIIAQIVHEFPKEAQLKMLEQAWQIGYHLVLNDANAPLPWNIAGLIKRSIEITFGIEHNPHFQAYLKNGGIMGILKEMNLDSRVIHRSTLTMNSIQIVVIEH